MSIFVLFPLITIFCWLVFVTVTGKEFDEEKEMNGKEYEDEKDAYGNSDQWKERVEKWKSRQEKKGLVNAHGGENDQAEEDDFL